MAKDERSIFMKEKEIECIVEVHEWTDEEKAGMEFYKRYLQNPDIVKPEVNKLVDLGAVNGIIEGFMQIAMKNAGFSADDIYNATVALHRAFDTYTAEDVRKFSSKN